MNRRRPSDDCAGLDRDTPHDRAALDGVPRIPEADSSAQYSQRNEASAHEDGDHLARALSLSVVVAGETVTIRSWIRTRRLPTVQIRDVQAVPYTRLSRRPSVWRSGTRSSSQASEANGPSGVQWSYRVPVLVVAVLGGGYVAVRTNSTFSPATSRPRSSTKPTCSGPPVPA
jgi:hypothetical protein